MGKVRKVVAHSNCRLYRNQKCRGFLIATTLASVCPPIAAEIVAPIVFAARRIGSVSKCAYLAVVAGCE
jgi:hypothetical protein